MAAATRADFDALYRAHYRDVHRFVFRLVQDASLAHELTQETFLRAFRAWGRFRSEAPERIWLLRIARNARLDHLRSPRARGRETPSLEGVRAEGWELTRRLPVVPANEPPLSVEAETRRAEMTACVRQFVLSLPESLRTPLILHDMEGLTSAEMAQILGCSVDAAKMRLHRARARLRQMMDERCDLFHDERNVLSCLPKAPERAQHTNEGTAALERLRSVQERTARDHKSP